MTYHDGAPRIAQPVADLTPARLRKLVLRLAQLAPGTVYTITLIVVDADSEPFHAVANSGKIENYCNFKRDVLS